MIDALVIGAGAAGLMAARRLRAARLRAVVVEARGRPGGRIFTDHDRWSGCPIEHGAEFVHGGAPSLMRVVKAARLRIGEVPERHEMRDRAGRKVAGSGLFERGLRCLSAADGFDGSVAAWLARADREVRQFGLMFVRGFHAADPDRASARAIARAEGSEELHRLLDGYDALVEVLRRGIDLRLSTRVERLRWRRGEVEATLRASSGGALEPIRARAAIVTVPLSSLQKGQPRFSPPLPAQTRRAIAALAVGSVVKVHLRFRRAFWKGDFGFLHVLSPGPFPTWWSVAPHLAPMLVGWCAGPTADALPAREADVIDRAIDALAGGVGLERLRIERELDDARVSDWRGEGAYSWIPVGAEDAPRALGTPIDDTLFIAGEATEAERLGTVHGALDSGLRAAESAIRALRTASTRRSRA